MFTYLNTHLVKQLFTSVVRPQLEYGNVVWHPQYRTDTDLLESVQHRATRLVPGFRKITYQERLRKMKLPSLAFRRLRGDAIEVYKYLHGIYRVDSGDILPLDKREGMATRGHSLKLKKRDCRTSMRANYFGLRVVNFWNSLPEEVVQATSVQARSQEFLHRGAQALQGGALYLFPPHIYPPLPTALTTIIPPFLPTPLPFSCIFLTMLLT
jgi:hypothetical protein